MMSTGGGSHYIYGKNSVKGLLEASPKRVFKIFLGENLKPDKRIDEIYQLAKANGILVQTVPRQKLQGFIPEEPDANLQGVVASVAAKPMLELDDLIQKCEAKKSRGEYPLLVMLDGVTDPRNLGAILRTADGAGVDGLIISKHKSAGFGPGVAKTASGAEETVDIAVVTNLTDSLKKLQESGFWSVGAANSEKAIPYYQQDYKMPTVLVLGSEGDGISRLVEKHCDFLVKIPLRGAVDSLNVSAAAAVLMFDIVQKHQHALR